MEAMSIEIDDNNDDLPFLKMVIICDYALRCVQYPEGILDQEVFLIFPLKIGTYHLVI
jgi:hypothetical protein